jgi:hypothetical protein
MVFKLKKFLAASLIIAALLPVESIAARPTICAGQPLPDGYELENLTSVPACDCVGAQDNAYVIRETDEFLSSQ